MQRLGGTRTPSRNWSLHFAWRRTLPRRIHFQSARTFGWPLLSGKKELTPAGTVLPLDAAVLSSAALAARICFAILFRRGTY